MGNIFFFLRKFYQIMHILCSWHILKVRNLVRTSKGYFKPNKRERAFGEVLSKPKVTKLCLNIQNATVVDENKSNETFQPSSNNLINSKTSESVKHNPNTWKKAQLDVSKLGHYYLKLSKSKLTSLVVLTSMIGYAMAPNSFELVSFLSCSVGTGLVSSAANSINQFLEIPFDAQMSRTRNRVLVQSLLTPLHSIGFASAAGSLGLYVLYEGTNGLTAILGASNLILYTMIYTPLKRISILNTWVGSIVGAIPPLMGWAASQGSLDASAFVLGGILYAWQFPHFNALSWNLRPDYSKAGYRMMAVTNPGLCRRTALRYTLGITACSSLAPFLNLTHWSFGILSLPINLYFVYLGFKFYKNSDSKNSRKLFRFSLLHLPALMAMMLITKKDLFGTTSTSQNSESTSSIIFTMKKFTSESEKNITSSSGFSGLTLGTTLHAQVK